MKGLGIAFAFLGLTLTSVESLAAERKLTGNEIMSTHSGHTFRFKASTGSTGEISYKADGTMVGKKYSGALDAGKWWVKDDKFCRRWKRWRGGNWDCFQIYSTGDKRYKGVRTDGGRLKNIWRGISYKSWMIK